jgi:hypothetical protein
MKYLFAYLAMKKDINILKIVIHKIYQIIK